MLKRLTALAIVAAVGMAVPAMAQTGKDTTKNHPKTQAPADQPKKDAVKLAVGDKAPAMSVEEWIKGDEVKKFEDGKVYVVEFWATWCGPCKESIPHLTKLQKDFKDKGLTVIGVAASERGASKDAKLTTLKKFVKDKGDQMGYTIAYDDDKSMSKDWLVAAGYGVIPTAFVVGKDNKIAWMGNPLTGHELEDAVKKAVTANSKAEGPSTEPRFITVSQQQPEKTVKAGEQTDEDKSKKAAADDTAKLSLGDKAPAITVDQWVKGEPVTGFEKGKTYVVEFWATWCGPCKISIPHLTELQKQYKEVKFIGVSVWESDTSEVKPFVKEEGDKMDYTVAMDSIPPMPEGTTGRKAQRWNTENGKMAKNWMKAAGQGGIPTAFIINGEGKVAWIGHPMEMEEPLKAITEGKWDIAAESAKAKKAAEAKEKSQSLMMDLSKAVQSGDVDKMGKAANDVLEADPSASSQLAGIYKVMGDKDNDKANAWARNAVDKYFKNDSQALNTIAWLIDPSDTTFTKKDLDLALRAATRADEVSKHKDPAIIDTLAAVYHEKGDLKQAIELQEKAVKLIADAPEAQKDQMEQELKDRLDQYREEQKKRQG